MSEYHQLDNHLVHRRNRSPRFLILLGLLALVATGCPFFPTDPSGEGASLDSLNAALRKLPDSNTQAKSILPAAVGPKGSLYGVLMQDNTQVFVLGSTDANGKTEITGVAWYDQNDALLLQEELRTKGATLFTPWGDAIDFDVTKPNARITMSLNATSPRSTIVMVVQNDGSLVVDQSASKIVATPNEDFGKPAARLQMADAESRLKLSASAAQPSPKCVNISTAIIWATQLACDIKTQITSGVPIKAIEATCMLASGMVDTIRATRFASDPFSQKAWAGLKAGITVTCEVGKTVVGVGSIFTKFNPLDAACLALSLAEAGRTMSTGKSLASEICTIFTSDQVLPGVKTTDYLLKLSVLDTAAEDGDMISIRQNGQTVFSGTVKKAPQGVTINLVPDLNHFEFEALNEGTSPPNTARVIIQSLEGTNLGLSSYDLNKGQIATLDIVRVTK